MPLVIEVLLRVMAVKGINMRATAWRMATALPLTI